MPQGFLVEEPRKRQSSPQYHGRSFVRRGGLQDDKFYTVLNFPVTQIC